MQRRFRQIDVFGTDRCGGNPVAVVLDSEGLSDEELRKFSVWTNLSECTFVFPPVSPEADYRVRIFSLSTELPFAGHPTLGTARAWLDVGGVPRTPGIVIQECEAGLIPIRISDQRLAFSAPPRIRSGVVDAELLETLIKILGITHEQVLDAEWLDNGPGWVGLLLDSAESVLALRPNASAFPGRWDIGVIGAHKPGSEVAFELRAFSTEGHEPLREDPITGSLNASAAEWLINTNRAKNSYVAAQGTAIGRFGRVHIDKEDGEIWVGGNAEVVISGFLQD
jgi:PhzF family phenazine biosynthesis protein